MNLYLYAPISGCYVDGCLVIAANTEEQSIAFAKEVLVKYYKTFKHKWNEDWVFEEMNVSEIEGAEVDFEWWGERHKELLSENVFKYHSYWYGLVKMFQITDNVEPGIQLNVLHDG